MPRVDRSTQYEQDSRELWRYITHQGNGRDAANKTLRRIEEKIAQLALMPLSGVDRSYLVHDMRSGLVKPYHIFYFPLSDGISLIRVIHGARDIERIFREGE